MRRDQMLDSRVDQNPSAQNPHDWLERQIDAYFSADVETDGPIPGPFSMLSFAIVYAGSFKK
jgi:hypothetical protein